MRRQQITGFETGLAIKVTDEPCPYCGKVRKVLPKRPKQSELRMSLQSFLPSMKLISNAAPKDDQAASDVPPSTISTPTTAPCQPSSLPAQSPLERLPLEIQERICRFVGLKDPRSEPHWMRYVKWEDRHQPCKRRRCCQIFLCALSLVSKSMAVPAQRALFENIILDRPRTLVSLCRSLLLYPKNRGYIRNLIVKNRKYFGQRYHDDCPGERHSHPYDKPDATAFLDLLGPAIREQGTGSVWALDSLRKLDNTYRATPRFTHIDYRPEVFVDITETIFALLIHFSPSLQSLSISGSWRRWSQLFQYSRNLFLDRSPPITKLVLDCSVLKILYDTEYSDNHWHPCLSTVQDLTLNHYNTWERAYSTNPGVKLDKLFDWFCIGKPRLRSLEINAFDDFVLPSGDRHHRNWNTILRLFKDTLRCLSMSGYRKPIDDEEGEQQMVSRFGSSSRMLTCLSELRNLVYLKVPLHYVSLHRPRPLQQETPSTGGPSAEDENVGYVGDSGANNADDDDADDDHHQTTITADNIRQHVINEFPPSLKIVDIIEYENYKVVHQGVHQGVNELDEDEIIRERKTYHIIL